MRTVKIGEEEVTMDPSILDFGETNLNEFLQKVGGHHAYFAEKHADAVWILGLYEQKYDEVYGKRFRELKGSGSGVSIPLAEAATKSDPEVLEAHSKMLAARLNKDLLGGFLKSIDKAFQAAMNYGYNKRKEMDKLNHDILGTSVDDPNEALANAIAEDFK
jgi:hypothetical protein